MAEEKTVFRFEKSGVILELPESSDSIIGELASLFDFGELDTGSDTAMAMMMYFPRTKSEMAEISNMVPPGETPDEEAQKKALELLSSGVTLFNVLGFGKTKTLESAMKLINPDGKNHFPEPVRIGSIKDYEYYLVTPDLNREDSRKKIDAFPPEMKEEYFRLIDSLRNNPQWFILKPQSIEGSCTPPGTAVSFEVETLDGEKLTSEELFKKADITVIDIWNTWCHFCIEEFPELDAIHKTYRDRGVQVVTVCNDADNAELKAKAKELTSPYSFLTFAKSESVEHAFIFQGTPTAYFADRNGTIMNLPVIGKRPDVLKQKLDALLEGTPVPAAEKPQNMQVYTVQVNDQNGTPVPGVSVGFCSDMQCNAVTTDENGTAVFRGEEFAWHVQLLKLPADCTDCSDKDICMQKNGGTVVLTLHRI